MKKKDNRAEMVSCAKVMVTKLFPDMPARAVNLIFELVAEKNFSSLTNIAQDLGCNPDCFHFVMAVMNEDTAEARKSGFDFLNDLVPESLTQVFKSILAL